MEAELLCCGSVSPFQGSDNLLHELPRAAWTSSRFALGYYLAALTALRHQRTQGAAHRLAWPWAISFRAFSP